MAAVALFAMGCWLSGAFVPVFAAEIHSNGVGGGSWSDPASWHGKAVPKAEDTVAIATGDAIRFDRDDDGKVTCQELYIDPDGALVFKPGGKRTLAVAGRIESYGAIKIDATGSADDVFELRMVGKEAKDRDLKLAKGGSLLVTGKAGLGEGKFNAIISSKTLPPPPAAVKPGEKPAPPPPPPNPEIQGSIEAEPGNMVDFQHVSDTDVAIFLTGIDNTGAKPNERLNFVGNRFEGSGRLTLTNCDTPLIAGNTFAWVGAQATILPPINLNGCPLTEIRGNVFRGKFERAINAIYQADGSVVGNTFEDCGYGIVWNGSNTVFKQNIYRRCGWGHSISGDGALAEDCLIEKPGGGAFYVAPGSIQITNTKIVGLAANVWSVDLDRAQAVFLNCDVKPETVHMRAPVEPNSAEAQYYLVVHVKGTLPPGSEIEVVTANPPKPLPPGATDMNIRNNFAPLDAEGWTPLPRTLKPLVVRGWRVPADGKVLPPPQYTVKVLGPEPKDDAPQPVIKQVNVTPTEAWYREKPDELVATLEITVP